MMHRHACTAAPCDVLVLRILLSCCVCFRRTFVNGDGIAGTDGLLAIHLHLALRPLTGTLFQLAGCRVSPERHRPDFLVWSTLLWLPSVLNAHVRQRWPTI